MRDKRPGSTLSAKWIILFILAAVIFLVYFSTAHRSFRDTLVKSFNEEQAFNVKLMSELIEHHLEEAAQNLKHIDSMIRHSPPGHDDYAHHASMIARDHLDDFSSISVLGYNGDILYHSAGSDVASPFTEASLHQAELRPGTGLLLSERVIKANGDITTYLFYTPPAAKAGRSYIICGEMNLKSFLKKEFSDYLGKNIGFLVADYYGDIYVLSSTLLEDERSMELGTLFDLDDECLECHGEDHFSDLERVVKEGGTVHHVFKSPKGRLLNRASGVISLFNERWIVSLTHPFDDVQGRVAASFIQNTLASLGFLLVIGVGALWLHRSEREEALKEQYNDIVNSISVGIFRMDNEGKINSANPALGDLLGVASIEDLKGGTNFFTWCTDPDTSMVLLDTIREAGRVRDIDLPMRRSGGGSFRGSLSATAHRDSPSGPLVIDAVLLDITLRKNAEDDLQMATAELERQNWELKELDRMKDRLVRDVSHELKTPVAKIAMQLEILRPLLGKHSLTGAEKDALDVLDASIRRQQGVIKNLLDLARLESGVREYQKDDIRLDRFFEELGQEFLPILEARGVTFSSEAPPLEIVSDREMLWHVFSNLVQNAVNFRDGESPGIHISVSSRNGGVEVRVADNGQGMEPKKLEKAFSRFYQSTASTEGSGVGLTICRRITVDLGGRVWLESEGKGRGVTAVVVLPGGKAPPST